MKIIRRKALCECGYEELEVDGKIVLKGRNAEEAIDERINGYILGLKSQSESEVVEELMNCCPPEGE